ncbi:Leucine-rich_repeat domain superfamily [Hexamita inflata]|uniref:Leucine-rich repeat domain superfamily n=1 Tax=Hexamita inflata TaxID=28002 RepID=A0AA86NF08_9EUKA|nr:Leucine-rich repeat domain superfamily [Hexamita inflata]
MVGITKLVLYYCDLYSSEALTSLVNLEELCLDMNKGIDITSLQYLTLLTKLSLVSCDLVNIDVLRPLTQIRELLWRLQG